MRRRHPSCLLQKGTPGLRPHLPNPPLGGGAGDLDYPAEQTHAANPCEDPGRSAGSGSRMQAAALAGECRCTIRTGRGHVRCFALCRSEAAGMRCDVLLHISQCRSRDLCGPCWMSMESCSRRRASGQPVHELRLGDNPELRRIVAFRVGPLFMFIHPISY